MQQFVSLNKKKYIKNTVYKKNHMNFLNTTNKYAFFPPYIILFCGKLYIMCWI